MDPAQLQTILLLKGSGLRRLVLPDLLLRPVRAENGLGWLRPDGSVEKDPVNYYENYASDSIYRLIADSCPSLEASVLDYRIRLSDAAVFREIWESCPDARFGWAPMERPWGIPDFVLDQWRDQGLLLEDEEGMEMTRRLVEVPEFYTEPLA